MSFSHSACDMKTTAGEHRQVIRQSPAVATCAQGGHPRLASVLLVAVLELLCLLSVSQGATSSAEQNWPQWRGPLQSGVAPHANPPTQWSETNNVKWKVKIPGEGTATPVIWENKVFVLTAIPTGKKVEPNPDDASSDEQNQRPGVAPRADTDQPGQFRGGQGGRGGPGVFGVGNFLGQQMLSAGDKNKDQKLTREEFSALEGAWFEKLDPDKAGNIKQ